MLEQTFGPPPQPLFDAAPTEADVAFFRENGFLVVERITSDEEIDWLRGLYEHIFDPAHQRQDMPPGMNPVTVAGELIQVFHPEIGYPQLLETAYFRNARRYAAALLGAPVQAMTAWGHLIRKPPGGRPATWHQDLAFWPPEYDYCAANTWLPMHDVPVEMGAMQFIPGSHKRGVITHRHEDAPALNLLTHDDTGIDVSTAVPCPLKKGGCTFHHPATLHYTAPNATDRPRLAFPATFQTEPVVRSIANNFPWMDEMRASGARQTTYVADGKIVPLPAL